MLDLGVGFLKPSQSPFLHRQVSLDIGRQLALKTLVCCFTVKSSRRVHHDIQKRWDAPPGNQKNYVEFTIDLPRSSPTNTPPALTSTSELHIVPNYA